MNKSGVLRHLAFLRILPGGWWRRHGCRRETMRGNTQKGADNMSGFKYKEQYAVVVICKDEKEQAEIYERLLAQGLTLKVVAV